MRALVCPEIGAIDRLGIGELPEPVAMPGEVVIDVHTAGVNFADLLVLRDLYQFKATPPFAPGMEAAGVVTSIGEGVHDVAVGDRVSAVGYSGAFAQRWAVPESNVIRVPVDIDFGVATALTVAYGTSYHALVQRAQVAPGDTLLVLGAAGGVGTAAVDIGRALGARVIAAGSTAEKRAFAGSVGAAEVIPSDVDGLREAIRDATSGEGVDIVLDPVGGESSEIAFRSLRRNGRHLVIGFAAGEIPSLPMNLPLLKEASLVGVFWGAFTAAEPQTNRANAEAMFTMVRSGELAPRITERFALEDAAEALRLVSERRVLGRVVVEIG